MSTATDLLRRNLARLAAVLACVLVWQLAQLPEVSQARQDRLAQHFSFESYPVSPPDRPGDRSLRDVAPPYRGIRAWVSSVGAGAALFAADGGTVSHDICLVDPRSNSVTVRPAPRTGQRYEPFTLTPPDGALPRFAAPMGCMPADLDENGWQDVVVTYWGRSPVLFLRRPGQPPGPAAYHAQELVTPPQVWNTNAATLGDFDGDGHLDLVFGNYFPDGARVLDPHARQPHLVMNNSLSAADNGGTNRLFRFTGVGEGPEPEVHFTEVPDAFADSVPTRWTLALGTQDLDGDGLPELYVGNDFGPDALLVNESEPGHVRFRVAKGERGWATPKSKVVGRDSFKGMGVAFTHLDPGRVPDILVSNITEPYALQESNFAFVSTQNREQTADSLHAGYAPYDDHSEGLGLSRTGWSWDVKAADFDNDGSVEIMHATGFVDGHTDRWAQLQETAMSNDLITSDPELWPKFTEGADLSGDDRNTFFTRGPEGRFVDIAEEIGVGTRAVSRSFAVGDVDSDGRLDFVTANQWAQSTMYHNTSPAGQFIGLRLRLPASEGGCSATGAGRSRPAVGATAAVTLADGTVRGQQVYPANGHNGVNSPGLLFGLGDDAPPPEPLSVRLNWRDGCGREHVATAALRPGWHTLVLRPDGTWEEKR